ncbi:hypothetical protein [Bifidobacterium miconisargentati]|nr:hypothetical protein [Bifidobacterium miconisargentati]MBW3090040.1 hypothetical protein [Bifidobacterium miconisargentati]
MTFHGCNNGQKVVRLLLQYKFQVDIAFPWAEVSSLVDKIWHDKYGDTIQ